MKVRLSTNTAIPGNLVIEAETPAEAILLRIWGNEKRGIMIKSFGGSIEGNQVHVQIGFREEKPSHGDREEKPSIGELKKDTPSGADNRMAEECATVTGKMDGAAAGSFYLMLLHMNVPDDVAGKMAVAYAREVGS